MKKQPFSIKPRRRTSARIDKIRPAAQPGWFKRFRRLMQTSDPLSRKNKF
jgi:hypothetical protein